jgi:transposase
VAGSLRDLIPKDHILRRVDRVLDLSWLRDELRDCYCEDNGRPGIDPEAALRLMLAGLFHGITHDRKLMREAQVNLAIRWFAGFPVNARLPNHSSLTRIRQRWGEERFRRIFQRTVQACLKAKLVNAETVHIDATLIRANVSYESYAQGHAGRVLGANEIPTSGEKRKVSRTDPDAGFATSSRKNGSEPSYKQHTAIDDSHGVIVDVLPTRGDVNEGNELVAQIQRIETATGKSVKQVTADAGYAHGKVYAAMEGRQITAVIPPRPMLPTRTAIPVQRFKYDDRAQLVRCPRGRVLRRSSRVDHGWVYKSRTSDCRRCPLRESCLSPSVGRRAVCISDGYAALLRARRLRPNWQQQHHTLYKRHRWRAEGAHSEAKGQHGLGRAIRRGLWNVAVQVYLTAAAMNLKRLAASPYWPKFVSALRAMTSVLRDHWLPAAFFFEHRAMAPACIC